LVKLGAETAGLTSIFDKEANNSDQFKNLLSNKGGGVGRSVESYVGEVYSKVPSSRIPKIKIDTPLYYTNSDRRQIVFDFVLFHEDIRDDPEDVLIKPIQQLMKYSSPHLVSDLNIQFPYMWDIRTIPREFIKYTTCALIGVQPTWNSPYIDHVPSSVNLQLTFMDMSPLYRDTIEHGSIIKIITKEEADSRSARNQATKLKNKIKIGSGVKTGPNVVRLDA